MFGGSGFSKSISSKLIQDIDLIQWNYGEMFQNKVADIYRFIQTERQGWYVTITWTKLLGKLSFFSCSILYSCNLLTQR